MRSFARSLPSLAIAIAVILTLVPLRGGAQQAAPQPAPQPAQPAAAATNPDSVQNPCKYDPRRRQFDWWIGTWDVHPWAQPGATGPRMGVNVISSIERGCGILESWTATGGGTGRSVNFFDPNTRQWRQLWVGAFGGILDYNKGEYRDGAMRFEGTTLSPQGQRIGQRLTFFRIHADTVRQLFEASTDSGRTWRPGFDARYIRRAP